MTKLKTKENQIEVFEKDEQFWTTSLDVAEKFGKQHGHILRDIEKLECSESSRQTKAGEQKYYIISRDGFSFLAMGFTGKKASEWKEKYIAAFNLMEEGIKELRRRLRQKDRQVTLEWKQLREDGKVQCLVFIVFERAGFYLGYPSFPSHLHSKAGMGT